VNESSSVEKLAGFGREIETNSARIARKLWKGTKGRTGGEETTPSWYYLRMSVFNEASSEQGRRKITLRKTEENGDQEEKTASGRDYRG